MGKIILGFIVGYVLSDFITSKVPQVRQFKIMSSPTAVTTPPGVYQPVATATPTWQQTLQNLFR